MRPHQGIRAAGAGIVGRDSEVCTMNQPEDDERQKRLAQRFEQFESLARDLSYLTRLEVLVVLGGITVAALIVLIVALIAALLRWLF